MHRRSCTVFQLLLLALSTLGDVVKIPNVGDVDGTKSTAIGGATIYSFYGIPYALPLTTDLRFKAPVAHPAWTGTLNCKVGGPGCPQPAKFTSQFSPNGQSGENSTSNDCLHLDVHTKAISGDKLYPVLVFFHGGGFTLGRSASLKPDFLLAHDIILVVPQFRLGPLGFLSLGTENIPGNAALFDQRMALQWVQNNIASFNGDPTKVTIAGHSTGAATATLHMFSPLSKGLFSQVIAHGGAGTAHWAVNEDPLSAASIFASTVHCFGDIAGVDSCLRDKTTKELMDAYTGENGNVLSPVVQTDSSTAFISKHPFDLLQVEDYNYVPLMAGFNKHEGLLLMEYIYKTKLFKENLVNNTDFLKNDLVGYISDLYSVPDSSGVLVDALTKRYFNDSDLGNFDAMYEGLVDLCGTSFAKGSVYRLVQFNSEVNSSYLYAFNYYTKTHLLDHVENAPKGDGVIHGDELIYLFPQEEISFSTKQKQISDTMTQLWANFIINGNPTPGSGSVEVPKWDEFTKDTDVFLVIDNDGTKMAHGFRQQLTVSHDGGLEYEHSGGKISSQISLTILAVTSYFMLVR